MGPATRHEEAIIGHRRPRRIRIEYGVLYGAMGYGLWAWLLAFGLWRIPQPRGLTDRQNPQLIAHSP
jgi:hypothetical protein